MSAASADVTDVTMHRVHIVLGIGNIGPAYRGTRHNIGFDVIDELARRHGITSWSRKHHAQIALWRPASGQVLLVKPETYVNGSGEAAQALLSYHQAVTNALLVVVDDLHLPLGTLRFRADGSAGGHNGLRDIEARLGPGYPRLRIGIGATATAVAQVDHVLGRWTETEQVDVTAMIAKGADAVEAWIHEGAQCACRFNGPLRPPPPRPRPLPPATTPPPIDPR